MADYILVFVTVPNENEGERIARTLVEEKLAACVNMVKNIRSIYRWQGKIEDDQEFLLIIKSRGELFKILEKRVKELHSYTVPEVISLPILKGSEEYLGWLKDSTT